MNLFKVAIALSAGAFFALTISSADARERLRKNEAWCLETSMQGNSGGGGTIFECNYETRAQCIQSKVTQGDQCWRNTR